MAHKRAHRNKRGRGLRGLAGSPTEHLQRAGVVLQEGHDALREARRASSCSAKVRLAVLAFGAAAAAGDNLAQSQSYDDAAIGLRESVEDLRGSALSLILAGGCVRG